MDKYFPIGLRTEVSSLAIDDKEIEANQFAAELLMPAAWVLRDARDLHIDFEHDDEAINDLADKYEVSVRAMTIRLSALGAFERLIASTSDDVDVHRSAERGGSDFVQSSQPTGDAPVRRLA